MTTCTATRWPPRFGHWPSAVTWDSVDSGQSEDIENSLTGQGTSDRETTREVSRDELVEEAERARLKRSGKV